MKSWTSEVVSSNLFKVSLRILSSKVLSSKSLFKFFLQMFSSKSLFKFFGCSLEHDRLNLLASSEQQIRCLGGGGERLRLVGAGRLEHLRLFLVLFDWCRAVRLPVVGAGQPSDAELKARAQRVWFVRGQ